VSVRADRGGLRAGHGSVLLALRHSPTICTWWFHCAQVCYIPSDRVHQGEEHDSPSAGGRGVGAEFRGVKLVAAGVHRFDGGAGWDGDSRVHSQPGRGRSADRRNELLVL